MGSNWTMSGDVIRGVRGIGVSKHHQRALLARWDEPELCLEDDHQVLSVPTRDRATWNPFSGSSSSRLYPETRRGMRGKRCADQVRRAVTERRGASGRSPPRPTLA